MLIDLPSYYSLPVMKLDVEIVIVLTRYLFLTACFRHYSGAGRLPAFMQLPRARMRASSA